MPFVIQWVDTVSGTEERINLDTPAGRLTLAVRQDVITQADWAQQHNDELSCGHPIQQRLAQYWVAPDKTIAINVLAQGSPYRHQIWDALCNIPLGETMSYSALAKTIASAPRAVGNACRDNPYPLFIPCHRVVSVAGMGGYCGHTTGDFMAIKHKLLAYEATFRK